MEQLGVNAVGQVLEAGRMTDCYLGLLLDPPTAPRLPRYWSSARPRCCIQPRCSRTAPRCMPL